MARDGAEASFNTEGGYQKRTEPFWLRAWTTKAIKGEAFQEQETPELVDSEEPEEESADDISKISILKLRPRKFGPVRKRWRGCSRVACGKTESVA